MASNTINLNLLKKDPLTDGNDTFNIKTMLNDNWDKIDEFAGKTNPISKGGTGATTAAQALSNLGAAAVSAVGNLHVWERVQSGVTDYLTSTDRNAYPDQSAEGGEPEKPAHYTLDEAETVDVLSSSADYSATLYSCDLDSVLVNNDGSISTTNFSVLRGGSNMLNSPGSWASFSPTEAYYITSGSDNVVFTDTIFTVSEETTLTYSGGKYVLQGCRKLIGHAKVEAIPANTTITYLGQLGGRARIEVGSYVGTGTYGEGNENEIKLSFKPKLVIIQTASGAGNKGGVLFMRESMGFVIGGNGSPEINGAIGGGSISGKVLFYNDGIVRWYSANKYSQFNDSNKEYYYCAFC